VLFREVDHFYIALVGKHVDEQDVGAARERARTPRIARDGEDSLCQLATSAETIGTDGKLTTLIENFAEALDFLLSSRATPPARSTATARNWSSTSAATGAT